MTPTYAPRTWRDRLLHPLRSWWQWWWIEGNGGWGSHFSEVDGGRYAHGAHDDDDLDLSTAEMIDLRSGRPFLLRSGDSLVRRIIDWDDDNDTFIYGDAYIVRREDRHDPQRRAPVYPRQH